MSVFALSVGFLFLFGLALGSFGTVIISRVPIGESIGGRSRCPHCKLQIAKGDLIPVASFVMLGGKCRKCKAKISPQYPLLEIGSSLLFILPSVLLHRIDATTVSLGLALWLFLLLAVMDASAQAIPDAVSLPLIGISFLVGYFRGEVSVLSVAIGGGFFFLQWAASRGRMMGSGDIFIGIAMGLLLGTWQRTALAIGIAYVIGAVIASIFLLSRIYSRGTRIAFIPYLFLGTLTVIIVDDWLLELVLP